MNEYVDVYVDVDVNVDVDVGVWGIFEIIDRSVHPRRIPRRQALNHVNGSHVEVSGTSKKIKINK